MSQTASSSGVPPLGLGTPVVYKRKTWSWKISFTVKLRFASRGSQLQSNPLSLSYSNSKIVKFAKTVTEMWHLTNNISDAIKPFYVATYTFSCVSEGNHTCHMRTFEDGRLWPHNDGTRCASCSGAYRKMMFPSSEEQENGDSSGPTSIHLYHIRSVHEFDSLVSVHNNESQYVICSDIYDWHHRHDMSFTVGTGW